MKLQLESCHEEMLTKSYLHPSSRKNPWKLTKFATAWHTSAEIVASAAHAVAGGFSDLLDA